MIDKDQFGPVPCNYVAFNDELWRIFGVLNYANDRTGNKESSVKIVIGELYLEPNDWSKILMMSQLNNNYFNSLIDFIYIYFIITN